MYNKTNWVDNSAPYINADALNKIENGIHDNFVEDSGWIDLKPYLVNGWVEYSGDHLVRGRNVGGLVTIEGIIKGGDSNQLIALLPEIVRPDRTQPLGPSAVDQQRIVSFNGSINNYSWSGTWTSVHAVFRKN